MEDFSDGTERTKENKVMFTKYVLWETLTALLPPPFCHIWNSYTFVTVDTERRFQINFMRHTGTPHIVNFLRCKPQTFEFVLHKALKFRESLRHT